MLCIPKLSSKFASTSMLPTCLQPAFRWAERRSNFLAHAIIFSLAKAFLPWSWGSVLFFAFSSVISSVGRPPSENIAILCTKEMRNWNIFFEVSHLKREPIWFLNKVNNMFGMKVSFIFHIWSQRNRLEDRNVSSDPLGQATVKAITSHNICITLQYKTQIISLCGWSSESFVIA